MSTIALAAIAPVKPATNDVHPVRNAARRPERLAQVDVLTAGARPQRSQLGVGHGARKRERAARKPRTEKPERVGNRRRDLRRREQDAAADDVGHDDRGRVERTETAIEREV